MRTHKTGASFARRGLTALAGLAVVAGTLVGVATPSQASVSGATITPSSWLVGSSETATVAWTESATRTSVMVRSPWPWPNSYTGTVGTPTSNTVTPTGGTTAPWVIACTFGTFTLPAAATMPGPVTCKSAKSPGNPNFFTAFWIEGVSYTGAVSVTLEPNAVTAPSTARTDTWIVGQYSTANDSSGISAAGNVEVASTAYAPAAGTANTYTISIDGNGGTCRTTEVTGFATTWGKAPDATNCVRSGYLFKGYNTSADGSGTQIAALGNIFFTGDNHVYAIWKPFYEIAAPVPPKAVKAVGGWNSITVSWDASPDPGDFEITNYMAASSPSNKGCITSVISYDPNRPTDANPLECKFTNLTPGTSYSFQVQALSGAGWGEKSAASNVATPYNMKITGYDRKKGNLFQLFKSTVTVSGVTPGYTVGTTITPWIKVGNGQWTKLPKEAFKTNLAGTFTWSKKFEKKLDGTPISVQFEDPQGNISNSINTSEKGKLAPSIKINSAKLVVSGDRTRVVVIGTALNVPDGSRVTLTFAQGAATKAVVVKLDKPGDFVSSWRGVDPSIPTVVKASVGNVESNPIRVEKMG